mgnify:CR=1 FL=1
MKLFYYISEYKVSCMIFVTHIVFKVILTISSNTLKPFIKITTGDLW